MFKLKSSSFPIIAASTSPFDSFCKQLSNDIVFEVIIEDIVEQVFKDTIEENDRLLDIFELAIIEAISAKINTIINKRNIHVSIAHILLQGFFKVEMLKFNQIALNIPRW